MRALALSLGRLGASPDDRSVTILIGKRENRVFRVADKLNENSIVGWSRTIASLVRLSQAYRFLEKSR